MTPTELKTARERMGISQEGLAKIIGIHPRTLRRYETGYYLIPKTVALLVGYLIKDFDKSTHKEGE